MTFLDLFAGVGGFRRGMELAGHECVGFCEYDKFAVASYTAMHLATADQLESLADMTKQQRQKEILNERYRNSEWYADDITRLDAGAMPRADCWCFGAPCQDFSVSGLRAGLNGSRSSLVREVFRLLGETRRQDRPRWLIYENVKGMLSTNKGFDFLAILLELDELGYDAEWQIVNSKDFGVPQSRERVYVVGCARDRSGSKVFPVCGSIGENNISIKQCGMLKSHRHNPERYRVYDPNGVAPTLTNISKGGGRQPCAAIKVGSHVPQCIKVREATAKGYTEAFEGDSINFTASVSKTRRGRVGRGVSHTLDTTCQIGVPVIWWEREQCYIAVRRLTPRECFRLQGWTDDYFEKAQFVNSDSQLYKQAGNGVTVSVIKAIAERMKI